MDACGFRRKEPQIKSDERRWSSVTGFLDASSYAPLPATDFGAAHRKGRKERKAQPQCGTRMTRIQRIFTDNFNPCASVSSVKSVFHHVCSSLKNPASGAKVSAFIRVHPRFLIWVIFQTGLTGLTGYVFNPVYPVILSNLKCQLHATWLSAKLLEKVDR